MRTTNKREDYLKPAVSEITPENEGAVRSGVFGVKIPYRYPPIHITPYLYAFQGLLLLGEALEAGRLHLRDRQGRLIRTLDEFCRAAENGEISCKARNPNG